MTADDKSPVAGSRSPKGRISSQAPAFAAVGFVGYLVDSAITYAGAKYLGLSPELARPPGFIVATIKPEWILYIISGSNFVLTVNTAIIWSSPRDMEVAKEEWGKRRAARRRWLEERFARDRRIS